MVGLKDVFDCAIRTALDFQAQAKEAAKQQQKKNEVEGHHSLGCLLM